MHVHSMRLTLAWVALAALSARARAEEGAWVSIVSAGPAVSVATGGPTLAQASLLLESAYGITDRVNSEGAVLVGYWTGRGAVMLSLGGEYVVYNSNHWRWNLGTGLEGRIPFMSQAGLTLGPGLETALRWLALWGFGFSLEVHASYQWDVKSGAGGLFLYPALGMYSEF